MSNNKVEVKASNGFFTLLTILFIGLKLTGHIAWSWWWVLAPIWIQYAFIMATITFVVLIYLLFAICALIACVLGGR